MSDELLPRRYQTITVRIFPSAVGSLPATEGALDHRVELAVEGWRTFPVHSMRVDPERLRALEADPKAYGLMLGQMLFGSQVLGIDYAATRAAVLSAGQGLRVRLRIDDPSLQDVRWERIYHPVDGTWQPLGATAATPFSRYLYAQEWDRPKPIEGGPLRMLAIIASPEDLDDHDMDPISEPEQRELHDTLDRLDDVVVTYLQSGTDRPPTLDNIQNALADGVDLVHYLGHGRNVQGPGGVADTVLYLEDEDGLVRSTSGADLVVRFSELDKRPMLCFLAACESASGWQSGTFVPLGPALVATGGVPAVIAMTDRVSLPTAQRFASQFYTRLLAHGTVDLAVNQARAFVQDEWDWGVPVLFSRLPDNQLLAANPIRTALQAIQQWRAEDYLPMPLHVRHLVRHPDPDRVEWLESHGTGTRELVETVMDVFDRRRQDREGGFLVLVGAHGSARSTHIWRVARETARQSLSSRGDQQTLPVYVDLQGYPSARSGAESRIEVLMLESLQTFWPGLSLVELRRLLRRRKSLTVRILLDGSDDLPDTLRRQAWREAWSLLKQYARHELMLVIDPDAFESRSLMEASDLLVIQPLSRGDIERFLRDTEPKWVGRRLLEQLEVTQLFDLAASPWLLINMLQQAGEGRLPTSRRQVLQNLVEDAVADVGARHGMRARAGATLDALAWEMHATRATSQSIRETFQTMETVRGSRGYGLEELFDALVRTRLLIRVGEERMRFAYPAIQAFCCARAIAGRDDRDRLLDELTATLGRPSRLRWWEDTLVLLSSLMPDPNLLLRHLVYGTNLIEGEQVFLAARCVVERGSEMLDPQLIERILDGLVFRLDNRNEPRSEWRVRAVQALGALRQAAAIPHLVRVANGRVRTDWRGDLTYEFSSVRRAAAVALLQMMPAFSEEIRGADPELHDLLQFQTEGNVRALTATLRADEQGRSSRAIAAFGLGAVGTKEAVEVLIAMFLDPDPKIGGDTRWAVTDALGVIDADLVTERVILPFLDVEAARQVGLATEMWNRRAVQYERLAYLIGKIRTRHPLALHFLTEGCLKTYRMVAVKGKAIQSLGWLTDRSQKWLFEQIAMGNLETDRVREQFALSEEVAEDGTRTLRVSDDDRRYLRRKAMEALARIGDEETVKVLRRNRAEWGPELLQTFYLTSEEIFARQSMGAIEELAWRPSQEGLEAGSS